MYFRKRKPYTPPNIEYPFCTDHHLNIKFNNQAVMFIIETLGGQAAGHRAHSPNHRAPRWAIRAKATEMEDKKHFSEGKT